MSSQKVDGLWFCVGRTSSFVDTNPATNGSAPNQKIDLSIPTPTLPAPCMTDGNDSVITNTKPDENGVQLEPPSPFKVFQVPTSISSQPTKLTAEDAIATVGLTEQVLVFKHRGKMHAVNHQCPHRSYPLLKGSVYDIEDFGILLSAGIVCPKHGWAFDLHTGESDRGAYRLRIWEIELRDCDVDGDCGQDDKEVWVKKVKKRYG